MRPVLPVLLMAAAAGAALAAPGGTPAPASTTYETECPTVPPTPEWVLEVAWAEGASTAQALDGARQRAAERLATRLCAGQSEWRCAAVKRHVVPWQAGDFLLQGKGNKRSVSACAAVAVERRFLDRLEQEEAALARELEAVAAAIRQAMGQDPVAVEPGRWASGCGAGDLGAAVQAALVGRMVGVPLARKPGVDTPRVQLTLIPGAERVTVNAVFERPAEGVAVPVGQLAFAPDLYAVPPGEVGACAANAALGLPERDVSGSAGLRVDVDLGSTSGVACEGAQLPLSVETTDPARVWLFSVNRAGDAWLVWPGERGGARVAGRVELGTVDVARPPGGGDERVVAVALPEGKAWPQAGSWTANCRVPGGVAALQWPAEAARGTATYTVLGAGEAGCGAAPAAFDPAALVEAMEALPLCGR